MSELWVFKHAPQTLDEYVGTKDFKEVLQKVIDELPNVILYGAPGCGKSSFVNILVKTTGYDCLQINASDDSGINMIRDQVRPISYASSFNDYKVVYLKEADRLSTSSPEATCYLMEDVQETTRFILVANDISGNHEALISRF